VSHDYPTGPLQAGNLKNHRNLELKALPRYIMKTSPLIFRGKVRSLVAIHYWDWMQVLEEGKSTKYDVLRTGERTSLDLG
jgi:hypothetical protein